MKAAEIELLTQKMEGIKKAIISLSDTYAPSPETFHKKVELIKAYREELEHTRTIISNLKGKTD